jgi:hypothetical protein
MRKQTMDASNFDQSCELESQHRNKSVLSLTYAPAKATGNFFLSMHWRQNLSHEAFWLLPELARATQRSP